MSGKKVVFASPKAKEEIIEQWIFETETQIHGKNEKQIDENTEMQKNAYMEKNKHGNAETQKNDDIDEQKEEIKRLTIDLPSSLHKAFKCAAIINDTTMVELASGLIEDYVRQSKS